MVCTARQKNDLAVWNGSVELFGKADAADTFYCGFKNRNIWRTGSLLNAVQHSFSGREGEDLDTFFGKHLFNDGSRMS